MSLNQILLLTGGIVLYRLLFNHKGKQWLLFVASLLGIFWLQPGSLIRYVDFWFPLATISLILLTYIIVNPLEKIKAKENIPAFLVIILLPLVISASRYLPSNFNLTATLPPQTSLIFLSLLLIASICLLLSKFRDHWVIPFIQLGLLIGIFIVLKNVDLQIFVINLFRNTTGQVYPPSRTQNISLTWLGFSYIAFRLIHTLRDFQNKRLESTDVRTFFNYVIFIPALTAGPIDRFQHFVNELKEETLFTEDAKKGGIRLVLGLVKKFVIADTLALFSINQTNVMLVKSPTWLWIMLLAFALMIFFDFSGYTDIALGMSALLGISLPENFNRPYLAKNLTDFWNRWHMTLTQWIRAYFFFPFTRLLKSKNAFKSVFILNSIPQLMTMVLIGLWHGISPNYLVWGVWHGIGLIIHTQWNKWMQKIGFSRSKYGPAGAVIPVASTLLTFLFVSIGWIWFVIPDVHAGFDVLLRLFGK